MAVSTEEKCAAKAKGGHARAAKLTPERRREIAKAAAARRWQAQQEDRAIIGNRAYCVIDDWSEKRPFYVGADLEIAARVALDEQHKGGSVKILIQVWEDNRLVETIGQDPLPKVKPPVTGKDDLS